MGRKRVITRLFCPSQPGCGPLPTAEDGPQSSEDDDTSQRIAAPPGAYLAGAKSPSSPLAPSAHLLIALQFCCPHSDSNNISAHPHSKYSCF
ncbi:hypothetical protein ACN47E_003162 [Coniothyrium glycines]